MYPAPNACWQLDATEYVLTGGCECVIFQLIDDHSRYAVASHVAWGETAEGAIAVVDKAIAAHGVPQRLLSDNGAALNPSRRGYVGQLVAHVSALGTEPITGKPTKPTTQGKNERFHQTLFRYLDKQPLADTLEQLHSPGRRVRPHPQHRAPTRGAARSRHPPDGLGSDTEGRRAAPQAGPPAHRPAAAARAAEGVLEPARRHPRQDFDQRRHLHPEQGHLPRRRSARFRRGSGRPRRGQDHRHRACRCRPFAATSFERRARWS
ncbi:DDE-type integrase/transposase/recombinase [Isoptericola nanjingensis]